MAEAKGSFASKRNLIFWVTISHLQDMKHLLYVFVKEIWNVLNSEPYKRILYNVVLVENLCVLS